jgi:hypothetical protein
MYRVAFLLVLVAALGIPGAASAQTVASTGSATVVREYAGTIVFSQFDGASGLWYLAMRRAGAADVERVAVAPSVTRFEADIGPDTEGRPALIYQRCSGTPIVPTGCDLFVYSLAGATGERAVRNANDPNLNDVQPTLWRGRIAWTRVYGSGKNANPVVYTKTLTAPRSRPSTRLPGVPRRRCAEPGILGPGRVCESTTDRFVTALELWRDNLAMIVRYACRGCSGIVSLEVRLDDVTDGTATRVAALASGLAGQWLVGPSVFAGRLAWYKACYYAEPACKTTVGPVRYTLATRRYTRGPPGPVRVEGFADTGSLLYENVDCALWPEPSGLDCRIVARPAPPYTPTRPPLGS